MGWYGWWFAVGYRLKVVGVSGSVGFGVVWVVGVRWVGFNGLVSEFWSVGEW